MDQKEIELIEKYRTLNPNFGYNLTPGGHENKYYSEETRKKISLSQAGENNSFYGKHHSEEEKKKVSETLKAYYKEHEHHSKGSHPSEETRQKMSEAHLGAKNSQSKAVICLETKKTYGSCAEAGRALGITGSGISSYCNKDEEYRKTHTRGNYHWQWLTDYEQERMNENDNK